MDDMEYVEMFGLPAHVAYTPEIADAMAEYVKNENIRHGMDAEEAETLRADAVRRNRELMAVKGLLHKKK